MALALQLTDAGLEACLSAKDKGLKAEITHLAFGSNAYTPSSGQTQLLAEKERIEIADYQDGGKNLRMAGVFDGDLEYAIREIGIFMGDILFGVYSQSGKILGYRSPSTKVVQWFTLNIEAVPTDSVTVVVGADNLNLILDKEFIAGASASIKQATAIIKNAHWNMQLSERLRQLEA